MKELNNEPVQDKTCAASEDSDQPAHQCSLIRVFADRMFLLQPPGYAKRDELEPMPYWVDGVVGWCEGAVYLTSPGRPTDIGLQLGKACYPCSG